MLKQTKEGWILQIKISPNASKNEVIKCDDGSLKIKITAQPIENKANKALIEFLSKITKIPKSSISIAKGLTGKEKTILFKMNEPDKIETLKMLTM